VTWKNAMNGAPVPNWVRVAAFWAFCTWVAATQYFGSMATQEAISDKVDSLRIVLTAKTQVDAVHLETVNARLDGIEEQLHDLGQRVDYRSRQTRNVLGEIDDKLEEVGPVIRKKLQRKR
jgi:hypothetical protein